MATVKMVALKKVRYPRGSREANEHEPGDTFEVLSENDAKALRLLKIARDADEKPKAAPETPKPAASEHPEARPRAYKRRDVTAGD